MTPPLRYRLSLAEIGVDVFAGHDIDLSFFDERAARFARTSGDPIVSIELVARSADQPPFPRETPYALQVETDVTRLIGGGVRMDLAGSRVRAEVEPSNPGLSFENVLRFWLSRHLLASGGALVHAAGLVDDFGAVAFPGLSGAGKSTLTLRHPPHQRISEDLLAVTRSSGRWFVHSLPFFAANRLEILPMRAPLAGLAFIRQSTRVRGAPLLPAQAYSRVAQSLVAFAALGLESSLLGTVVAISREVPAIELELDLASPVWPELRRHFGGTPSFETAQGNGS